MVHVTYIEHGGDSRTVDIAEGISVMDGALRHHIPGIEGDCGGACACGTCHVYVEPEWFARLEPANELETRMLKMVVDPKENSRLACQIVLKPELDGLTVHIPESQY